MANELQKPGDDKFRELVFSLMGKYSPAGELLARLAVPISKEYPNAGGLMMVGALFLVARGLE